MLRALSHLDGWREGAACMVGGLEETCLQGKDTSFPYSFFPCGFHSVAVLIPA